MPQDVFGRRGREHARHAASLPSMTTLREPQRSHGAHTTTRIMLFLPPFSANASIPR